MNSSRVQAKTERSLAAIVLTDAVGFSARMSVDEESTLQLIRRDLDLIARLCDRFGGKVLKSTGDGLLMSFYSAVQAVLSSQEIQKQFAHLSEGLPPEEYLQHRIGIHLGDVLFSHKDVLGNGVNIAARLQTQATPGGICISQTVYDVVKARVDINATFIGPLKLKNIQDPVAAFQIPPYGQSATMVVSHQAASSSTSHQGMVLSPLATAALALEQDPQVRRIKKLLFGTYQGVWENDPKVLAQFDLLALLEKLHQRHPTLAALAKALQTMATRLNHHDIYMTVAGTILSTLDKVAYAQVNAPNKAVSSTPVNAANVQGVDYCEIAQGLSQQSDRLRIKKLLYAIIHTVWENDPATLGIHAMADLVAEVHHLAPTEVDLSHHLERIIRRLNRQNRYTQLALIISEAFHPLYSDAQAEGSGPEGTVLSPNAEDYTAMMEGELSHGDEALTSLTRWNSAEASGEPTNASMPNGPPMLDPAMPATMPMPSRDRTNLFMLRHEIMRYTNPLRAKILLLSTVRSPFTATPQDWLALKSHTLDDLIRQTFEYCPTFSDLESKLTIMCHCVNNVGENVQTAGAILQAMKPFY